MRKGHVKEGEMSKGERNRKRLIGTMVKRMMRNEEVLRLGGLQYYG